MHHYSRWPLSFMAWARSAIRTVLFLKSVSVCIKQMRAPEHSRAAHGAHVALAAHELRVAVDARKHVRARKHCDRSLLRAAALARWLWRHRIGVDKTGTCLDVLDDGRHGVVRSTCILTPL